MLGAWGENSLFFEPIGRKQGAVRVDVQLKDAPPRPGFTLKIESEGPRHNPTLVRLIAEEIADVPDVDEVIYQAIATLPVATGVPIAGKPGVPRDDVIKHVKKSKSTVQRALRRLEDAGRILVTGQLTKKQPMYAVNVS